VGLECGLAMNIEITKYCAADPTQPCVCGSPPVAILCIWIVVRTGIKVSFLPP